MKSGMYYFASGNTYEGEFDQGGYMCGEGTLLIDEEELKGTFYQNKLQGEGTMTNQAGDVYSGKWKAGLLEGFGRYKTKQTEY